MWGLHAVLARRQAPHGPLHLREPACDARSGEGTYQGAFGEVGRMAIRVIMKRSNHWRPTSKRSKTWQPSGAMPPDRLAQQLAELPNHDREGQQTDGDPGWDGPDHWREVGRA